MQASSIKKPDLIPPVSDELTQELARDLLEFVNQLFAAGQRDMFAAMEEADVSITQAKTLRALAEADEPMSLGAVSETLGLSLPAISRVVDALVRRGLVKREEDPRDRRSKLVTATARGRSTYERLTALRLAGIRDFVADLDPEEQRGLADALAPVIRRPRP